MISSRLHPLGTAAFRPVVGGLSRPHVATGFRPVVAGQYLRADQQLDASALTYLNPVPTGTGGVHLSVVVSPRIVWQVMNAIPAEATARRIGGGFGTAAGKPTGPSADAGAAPPPASIPANRFPLLRDTVHTAASGPKGDDRFMVFRTHAVAVSAPLPTNDGSQVRPDGQPTAAPSHVSGSVRMATADRLAWLRELAERTTAGKNTFAAARRAAAMSRDTIEYSPVVLTLRTGADGTHEPTDTAPRNASWASAFAGRIGRSRTVWRDAPAAPDDRSPRIGDELSVNVVVGRTLRRFARDTTLTTQETIRQSRSTRESTTAEMTFGRTAKVGAYRPATLVPAIDRVSPSESGSAAGTESILVGSRTAGAFADAVVARLIRTDAGGMTSAAAPPVPAVVRTRGESSAATARPVPAESATFAPDPRLPVQSPPPGLPPDLVQRLTEQVVQSLDARALAARERMGRF